MKRTHYIDILTKTELSWKKSIFFLVLTAFSMVHGYYILMQIVGNNHEDARLFFSNYLIAMFAVGLGFTAACLAAASLFCNLAEEKLVVSGLIIFGTVYLFLFAPITVPDEPVHFCSAYYISNLLCCPLRQLRSELLLMRETDMQVLSGQFYHLQSQKNYVSILTNFTWFSGPQDLVGYNGSTVITTAPFGYLFSGLGIAVGRLLGLGTYPVFYLGRIFNLLAYTFLTWLAIKRTPIGKTIIGVISFFPMTLHEIASFSYDFCAIAFVFLFVSNILYWICSDERMQWKDILICIFLGVLASTTKVVYVPLLASIFFIPPAKIGRSQKQAYRRMFVMFAICLLCYLAVTLPFSFSSLSRSELTYVEAQSFTLGWTLHHPIATIKIFVNTLYTMGDWYLETLLGTYLGWFQIVVSQKYVHMYLLLLLLATFIDNPQRKKISLPMQLAMPLFCIGSGALAMASMFFGWTPVGSDAIAGVQGRYFLPILFPFCSFLRTDLIRINYQKARYLYSLVFTFAYLCVMEIALASYL